MKTARLLLLAVLVILTCGYDRDVANINDEANRLFDQGKIDEAKALYEEVKTLAPESAEVRYNLANVAYNKEAYEDALKEYLALAKAKSLEAKLKSHAYYNAGDAYYRMQKTDEAIEAYKKALWEDPKDEDAKFNLELLLKKKNEQNQEKQDQKDQDKQDQNKSTKQSIM
ncbi:MAG: tetratricopeptide repeat protein [Candidatus Omnitrophica bacterium]|nr:tetratricopeptide repeat protein [Candidatus Omnitrophota bacterium]